MGELDESLQKVLLDIAKYNDYDNPSITKKGLTMKGANYTSLLYEIKISADGREDLELFAKVANMSEEMRKNIALSKVYIAERYFYQHIVEDYEFLHKNNKVPNKEKLLFPKLYGINSGTNEEILVLENLKSKGFTVFDRLQTLTWAQARKAIENLAKFHALSLAYQEQMPENFERARKLLEFEVLDTDVLDQLFAPTILSAYEAIDKDNLARVKKYFDRAGVLKVYTDIHKMKANKKTCNSTQ